jgi:hypothetical protein
MSPLQLIAYTEMLNDQGIKGLPTELATVINQLNSLVIITNFNNAVNSYVAQPFFTEYTLNRLLTIGANVCPALGNGIPPAYSNLTPISDPPGLSGFIEQTASNYLGVGDLGKFAQGFMAVYSWMRATNQFINSVDNAQTYLGPTFTNMNSLITNSISDINSNFAGFGVDLLQQGKLWDLNDLDSYGTPAGLLRQLSRVGQLQGGTLAVVQSALTLAGLTENDTQQLIAGQGSLTVTEFNVLQRLAYQGMLQVKGADLEQVLAILDVITPNIQTMADLLNPVKTFPNSYSTLTTPSPTGPLKIYNPGTSVPSIVGQTVSQYLPTPTGCDELAKIIPPDQAVANKAIAVSLQQGTGMPLTTLSDLAQTVQGGTTNQWNPQREYLANSLVAYGQPLPTYYRAQQDVPSNTDIVNTNYWLPTSLGGLNTLSGLPLVEDLTQPVPNSVTSYVNANVATGSGPNGTITLTDILGLAVETNSVLLTELGVASNSLNSMNNFGLLTNLNTVYLNMLTATTDAQMNSYIDDANNEIAAINSDPLGGVFILFTNGSWNRVAEYLSKERAYQIQTGVDYLAFQADENSSIMSFAQLLPSYGLDTSAGGACEFINLIADTSVLAGQAIVGTMRQGQNQARLANARLGVNIAPNSTPAVTPPPAVTPVY